MALARAASKARTQPALARNASQPACVLSESDVGSCLMARDPAQAQREQGGAEATRLTNPRDVRLDADDAPIATAARACCSRHRRRKRRARGRRADQVGEVSARAQLSAGKAQKVRRMAAYFPPGPWGLMAVIITPCRRWRIRSPPPDRVVGGGIAEQTVAQA